MTMMILLLMLMGVMLMLMVMMVVRMHGNHATVLGGDKTCLSGRKDHHQYSGGEIRQQGIQTLKIEKKEIALEHFELQGQN